MKFDWKRERRWLATLGAAIVVAGYVRYATQGEMTRLNEGLLIGGGVLFLAAAALSYRELIGFFGKRSAKLSANTFTLTLLVLIVVGLVNYLGFRHDKRLDLTSEKLYTLSDQSRKVASGLQKDIDIIRFGKTPDPALKDVVTEYTAISPHIHYRDVDPQESPQVAKQYNVTHMNQVIVASGARNETLDDTTEPGITNAILKLTRDSVKTVCFVEGHGEKSISASDPEGLANMDGDLKGEGYATKAVNLVSEGQVPSDCSVLVLAGPKTSLFPQESQMIGKYLDNGGKAFFMLDPETDPKVDDVLQTWNIKLGENVVIDASGVGRLFGTGPAVPLVTDYGASPITQNFTGSMTFFPLARTVSISDKSKNQPDDVELLKTSARSFTVPNLKTKEVRYDPAKDTAGPLSIGVAADRMSGSGNPKDSRLVVLGDSAFATNQWAGLQRNGDLFMNVVNWLAEDENLISIRPKSPTNRRVTLTEAQERALSIVSLIMLPGIVLLSGGLIWLKRR